MSQLEAAKTRAEKARKDAKSHILSLKAVYGKDDKSRDAHQRRVWNSLINHLQSPARSADNETVQQNEGMRTYLFGIKRAVEATPEQVEEMIGGQFNQ